MLWERNSGWAASGTTYFSGARLEALGSASCPREMGWQGNSLSLLFSLPADAARTSELRLDLAVEAVWTGLTLTVSAGPEGGPLIGAGTLTVRRAGVLRFLIPAASFRAGGRNELRLKGDNRAGFGEPSGIRWNSLGFYRAESPVAEADDEELLDDTQWRACRYFYEQSFPSGLVLDTMGAEAASLATVGFGATAMTILADRAGSRPRWAVSAAAARARAEAMMDTLLAIQSRQAESVEEWGYAGLPYHFLDRDGRRARDSEVSTVDGALMLAGVLQAGAHFGGALREKARAIASGVELKRFYQAAQNRYSHGYRPGQGLLASQWDRPGDETLLVALLSLAEDTQDPDRLRAAYGYPRVSASYGGIPVVRSYFGSLFTYTFAHFWIPFECLGKDLPAAAGMATVPAVDWWANSVHAVEANRRYHLDRLAAYPDLGAESFGASACFRSDRVEYFGANGAAPAEAPPAFDGTLPPHGAIMSLFLARKEAGEDLGSNPAFQALRHYYRSRFGLLWCSYGPRSSFDASGNQSPMVVGIEKGPEALGIEAYRTGRPARDLLSEPAVAAAVARLFERSVCPPRLRLFVRGRINAGGDIDLSDAVALLQYLFLGGAAESCADAMDVNDDGVLDLSDGVRLLGFLFQGASAPPPPFPDPGLDPTPDGLAPCYEEP